MTKQIGQELSESLLREREAIQKANQEKIARAKAIETFWSNTLQKKVTIPE